MHVSGVHVLAFYLQLPEVHISMHLIGIGRHNYGSFNHAKLNNYALAE